MEYAILGLLCVVIILLFVIIFKPKNNNINSSLSNDDIDNINKAIADKLSNQEALNKKSFELIEEKNKNFYQNIEKNIENIISKCDKLIENVNKGLEDISLANLKNYSNLSDKLNEYFNKLYKENTTANNEIKEKLQLEIKEFNKNVKEALVEFSKSNKEAIEKLENTVGNNLRDLREDNSKKLELINNTVSEKLEKTLEGKLKQSFDNVIEQIGGVNKAIGEIKGLASDVGSLKTVLTNVKTKGIVGEVILSNIIKDILTVDQYEENIITKKNSSERVEFAIKMPGSDDDSVYLPIDSKLPLESYHKIKDGMENGNPDMIKEGRKELRNNIKKFAKDISEKYIDVPNTTDFAIMFLPIEGLYIEALDMGLFEEIQREYKVNIAGPTTLTAILNSLQMGFKTLIIQKKSADVFKLLGAVKTEFNKFAATLEKTQKKVGEASDELDKLVGTRTRMLQSKLKNVDSLDVSEANELLGIEE
ncbi:MAG: DNA recombination protein RmuC [Acholeplasmatales bacterium]|nr:DNA recombination protein RmuC [Acholeplasmatales bacterium]